VIEELPVTWNRVPFLACVPPRLTLGTRQQRVFLCCPDREVELIKVLKVPTGLVVTITAPRELTVDLGEDVPDVLEGTIEVETSAHDHRLLRIPVVRYQPIIADTR
jgi:hypothetical protein